MQGSIADRHQRGVFRLMLVLMVAWGCVLAWLLIQQRLVLARQRDSLAQLSQSYRNLQDTMLMLAVGDEQGPARADESLSAFRQCCLRHHLDLATFEHKIQPLLAAPPPSESAQWRLRMLALEAVEHEAEDLFESVREGFEDHEGQLRRWVSRALLLETVLCALACGLGLSLLSQERKTGAALAKSEAMLRLVADNLPDSYLYQYEHQSGQAPRFQYTSSGVERVHGLTAEQVVGDSQVLLGQILTPFSDMLAVEAKSLQHMSDFSLDLEFRRLDGDVRTLRLRSRPRLQHDGRVVWDGLASDVTESLRAEQIYQALFENAFEGVYQTTPAGRLLNVNPAMARTFGFASPKEMLESWTEAGQLYADPADRGRYRATLQEHGSIHGFEFQGRRRDGSLIWISTNARAVRNSAGEVEFYEGTGLDISERKQALERIRQLIRVHAMRTDINQCILRGVGSLAMLESACGLAVDKGQFQAACVLLLEGGLAVRAQSGGQLPLNWLEGSEGCPVLNPALGGQLSIANDLKGSEAAWKSQALEAGYRSLAVLPLKEEEQVVGLFVLFSQVLDFFDPDETQLISELAGDLSFALSLQKRELQGLQTKEELRVSQEHFRQAQKMEVLGQLAGGVAHDFNNILAVIMMETELLLASPELREPELEGLREVHSSAGRAANLTRQLLLFSRRQVMQPSELDLNEVVTQLAKMLRRVIGEDVALQLNLCSRAVQLRADAGMLDQVLVNLAVNSRDAMPKGGVLTISTEERYLNAQKLSQFSDLAPGRYCRLSVSDTGCGMSAQVLEHIFEPFYTTKEQGKGTGLGLATVFGIIKQHQGFIEVSSHPGEGTTFTIHLPSSQAAPEPVDREKAPNAELPRGTETVLLVEDDASVRRITSRVLRSAGYTVVEARQGEEALHRFEEDMAKVDLLLTDIVMPGQMTGRELADCCRQRRDDLPVLFMSGYNKAVAGRELELAPGEFFLQKPFTPPQILQSVREALRPTP
ncbi:PAS domain S-box protein [bacterium]|nr:PAS domain S-box protein [bacterium]